MTQTFGKPRIFPLTSVIKRLGGLFPMEKCILLLCVIEGIYPLKNRMKDKPRKETCGGKTFPGLGNQY